MALSAFGKSFNLNCHKEVMPYNIYTYENVSRGRAKIIDALNILPETDRITFNNNIAEWDCKLKDGVYFD